MDVLSDILDMLRVTGSMSGHFVLGAPWALRVPPRASAAVHLVTQGSCVLTHQNETLILSEGDLVMFPHSLGHSIASTPGLAPGDFPAFVEHARNCQKTPGSAHQYRGGGPGPQTTILCAEFEFVARDHHPLLEALPERVVMRHEEIRISDALSTLLRFLVLELSLDQPGAQVAINRLLDVLLVQIIRVFIHRPDTKAEPGWLNALSDPQIASAIARLHADFQHPWTVGGLARTVGMSRSGFAEHFRNKVGLPPLSYLRRWRLQRAAYLLHTTRQPVGEIAHQVGYRSEPSFNKAFHKMFGCAPGQWRRQSQTPTNTGV
ncbi:MAG: AraC family transcriptional regulator [Myxococcota bacterium]